MMSKGNWRKELQNIYNEETKVDLEKQWSILEERLEKKKKRRLVLPFFLGLSLLSIGIYLVMERQTTIGKHVEAKTETKTEAISFPMANSTLNQNDVMNPLQNGDDATINATSILIKKDNDHPIKRNITEKETAIITNQNINVVKKEILNKVNFNNNNTSTVIIDEIISPVVIQENKPYVEEVFNSIALKNSFERAINTTTKEDINTPILPIREQFIISFMPKQKMDLQTLVKVKRKPSIDFVDLTLGVGISNYVITKVNNEHKTDQYKVKPLESINVGIGLGKFILENTYTTVSLSAFQQKDEIKAAEYIVKEEVLKNQVIEEYTNSFGDIERVIGDQKITRTYEKTSNRFNSFNQASIFLGIGQRWNLKQGRVYTDLNLGANFYNSFNGHIYNGKLKEEIEIVKAKPLSFYVSAAYEVPLVRNFDLTIGYRYLRSNLLFENMFDRTLNNHSFNIGIKKHFN